MSGNQMFVKNTNTPPEESELWSIGEGWKISAKGKTYTNLDKIYKVPDKHPNAAELNAFPKSLVDQLTGRIKDVVDYIGYYFVASTSTDGTELVYAFEKTDLDGAKKQVKYAFNPNRGSTVTEEKTQSPAPRQTAEVESAPSVIKQTITVPFDRRPIAWNDFPAIEQAEEEGLIPLPVVHTGAENWGKIGKDGHEMFWWGRLRIVEIESHQEQ